MSRTYADRPRTGRSDRSRPLTTPARPARPTRTTPPAPQTPPRWQSDRRAGNPKHRLVGILGLMALFFGLLVVRVGQLQALAPERYVRLGEEQTVHTTTIAAERGSIYDRNGAELALSTPRSTVYADPKFVTDAHREASTLAPLLHVDAAKLEKLLSSHNRFDYLARQVPSDVVDRVKKVHLDGVYFVDEPYRDRPNGGLARSLLGFTNIDNIGLGGLERQYDKVLTGTPGRLTVERDPQGRTISGGHYSSVPAVPGQGLVLTIDRSLQYQAERLLEQGVARTGADGGTAVVMNPRTGEILAMANVDTDPRTGDPRVSANNLALTTVFEPGSVMKTVTLSGVLEEHAWPTSQCVPVPGVMTIAGSRFSDFEQHGAMCTSMTNVLVNSYNTGTINLAKALGPTRLSHYFDAFGFGQSTGLGFPNEQSGYVRPLKEWWGSSLASMSIGQGVSATPMQMLEAINTLANGGVYVPARVVSATIDGDGNRHAVRTKAPHRVISQGTSQQVRDMMVQVVSRGTAETAQVAGYTVAGKTGTAQIPAPNGGYVWPDGTKHYMATFAGFLPAENPQLSIIVVTNHPTKGVYTGGTVSGPVFSELASFAIRHFQIPAPSVRLDLGGATAGSVTQPHLTDALGDPPEGRYRATPARRPDPAPTAG